MDRLSVKVTNRNEPVSQIEIERFIDEIKINQLESLLDFYKRSNGAEFYGDESYISIWPLETLIDMNEIYNMDEFISGYFFFGTNGSDAGFAIHIDSGKIFEIPFISISEDEALFIFDSFYDFITSLQ